ncbi:hypothetical protein O0J72_20100, partial [Stenotrophomonas sp. Sm3212]|uniref:hypothetical protein n=1 Tax=Stenotrophomonas sp. Sm3212 TaxID=3002748 RepID=UPI0027E5BDE0
MIRIEGIKRFCRKGWAAPMEPCSCPYAGRARRHPPSIAKAVAMQALPLLRGGAEEVAAGSP